MICYRQVAATGDAVATSGSLCPVASGRDDAIAAGVLHKMGKMVEA
jgi:hypothetical protein